MMSAVPSPSGESAVSPLVSRTARSCTPGDGWTNGGTAIRPAPTRATPKVRCRRSIRGLSLGVRSCNAPSNGEQNYSTTANHCEARSPKSSATRHSYQFRVWTPSNGPPANWLLLTHQSHRLERYGVFVLAGRQIGALCSTSKVGGHVHVGFVKIFGRCGRRHGGRDDGCRRRVGGSRSKSDYRHDLQLCAGNRGSECGVARYGRETRTEPDGQLPVAVIPGGTNRRTSADGPTSDGAGWWRRWREPAADPYHPHAGGERLPQLLTAGRREWRVGEPPARRSWCANTPKD